MDNPSSTLQGHLCFSINKLIIMCVKFKRMIEGESKYKRRWEVYTSVLPSTYLFLIPAAWRPGHRPFESVS